MAGRVGGGGRYRGGRQRPSYTHPVVLTRDARDRHKDSDRAPTNLVYVLAPDTDEGRAAIAASVVPVDHQADPAAAIGRPGAAWWPEASRSGESYRIPYRSKTAMPLTASADVPVVLIAEGIIDGEADKAWGTPSIYQVHMTCDWRESLGGESISGGQEVADIMAMAWVRTASVNAMLGRSPNAKEWSLQDVVGGLHWDILAVSHSWERNRFVEFRLKARL